MINGIHHISMKCKTPEEISRVKAAGYDVFIEPNDLVMDSSPKYPVRMAFCHGPLGEEIEFFCELHTNEVKNPWEEIDLDNYEKHMSLGSVMQLQTMNSMMKDQFDAYPVQTVMILGIAGGNGLEYVDTEKFRKVYGVDINEEYLKVVSERYAGLSGVLECLHVDLVNEADRLPQPQMLIANLLIEYIGYSAFQNVVCQTEPEYVSCIIQINTDEEQWVSDSPYIHAFDGLNRIHHQMDGKALEEAMSEIGYDRILKKHEQLPNGKSLVRLDFQNKL